MNKKDLWTVLAIIAVVAVFAFVDTVVFAAAPAQAVLPQGFCANLDGYPVDDQHPWPGSDPCSGNATFEVLACQTSIGVYDPQGQVRELATWQEVRDICITGVIWAKPKVESVATPTFTPRATATPTFTPRTAATAMPTATTQVQTAPATTGQCAQLATREQRLDCATQQYFEAERTSGKLAGIKAYLNSLGATYSEIAISDPFQPDTEALKDGTSRMWGALVQATNLKVTGNSCLVTDVSSRIASFGWVYNEPANPQRPSVGHYGEAVVAGSLTEIAFHGDCSDWPEIRLAANMKGYTIGEASSGLGLTLPATVSAPITVTVPVTMTLSSAEVVALQAQVAELRSEVSRLEGMVNSLTSEFTKFLGCIRNPDAVGC